MITVNSVDFVSGCIFGALVTMFVIVVIAITLAERRRNKAWKAERLEVEEHMARLRAHHEELKQRHRAHPVEQCSCSECASYRHRTTGSAAPYPVPPKTPLPPLKPVNYGYARKDADE